MGQELEEIRRIRVGTVPPSPQCCAPARVFPRLTINRQPIIRRMPRYVIRTAFSESTVRVYQAYRAEIALAAGRFVPPFSMGRMTWIKPSFNWMMYRCGYATKSGQEVVLGIDITREGFEWALEHAVLSSFNPSIHSSHDEWRSTLSEAPVRIQWDPERDWRLSVVDGVRAIQIGLTGEAVQRYVDNWIVRLEDVTPVAHRLDVDLKNGAIPDNLPDNLETPYPLSSALRLKLSRTILPTSE
jgi:hypothetical protein